MVTTWQLADDLKACERAVQRFHEPNPRKPGPPAWAQGDAEPLKPFLTRGGSTVRPSNVTHNPSGDSSFLLHSTTQLLDLQSPGTVTGNGGEVRSSNKLTKGRIIEEHRTFEIRILDPPTYFL